MDGDLIIALIFYSIIFLLIYTHKDKFTIINKVLFLYKTQKGVNLMKWLAKFKLFWNIFSIIAIPTAVYFMIKVPQMLFYNALSIAEGVGRAGVALAIPGIKIPGSPFFIPLWYGIISIAVLAFVHEFAHGIVAAMEGIKIKSTGFGFLTILPLAFVELDEDELRDMPRLGRMKILASGAFMNISVYIFLLIFIGYIFSPFVLSLMRFEGIAVTSVVPGHPAAFANITDKTIITSVNKVETLSIVDFVSEMSKVHPGESVILGTNQGYISVKTTADPQNASKPYIGVFLEQKLSPSAEAKAKYGILVPVINWIYGLVWWIANLNLWVGIMNFLPIWALDGSKIFYDITSYLIKKEKILFILLNIVASFSLGLLLFNLFGPAFF